MIGSGFQEPEPETQFEKTHIYITFQFRSIWNRTVKCVLSVNISANRGG